MNARILGAMIGLILSVQAMLGWKPSVFIGVYLYLPLLCSAILVLHLAAKAVSARPQTEKQTALIAILAACLLGLGIGLIGGGNDGSTTIVLPPADLVKSLISGGFLPWKQGMMNLLRFLPLTAALSCTWFAFRRAVPKTRMILTAVLLYLGLSVLWHLPSLIALVIRQTGTPIETAQDVYVILIRALTNSYWVNETGSRFLSPIAEQGKSGLVLFHAAILMSCMACVSLSMALVKAIKGGVFQQKALWNGGGLLAIGITGLLLGQSVRVMPKLSAVSLLVDVVFLICMISGGFWLYTEQAERGAEEQEKTPNLALSLFIGSSVMLGWPVFLGGILGPFTAMLKKELHLENVLGENWAKRLVLGATCIGLGWGALTVGLQDITPFPWMIRLMLSFALAVAMVLAQKAEKGLSPITSSVTIGLSALLSGQSLIGLAALPAIICVWILESRENSHKWRILPLLLFTLWAGFCLLFFPSAFSRV